MVAKEFLVKSSYMTAIRVMVWGITLTQWLVSPLLTSLEYSDGDTGVLTYFWEFTKYRAFTAVRDAYGSLGTASAVLSVVSSWTLIAVSILLIFGPWVATRQDSGTNSQSSQVPPGIFD
jgi:hypothetical protein